MSASEGPAPMGADAFARGQGVSRETQERLEAYAACLEEWQGRMNLVGRSTMEDLWRRHMQDSAQLLRHVPQGCRRLVDLGSGAGFPGLVLSIMGVAGVELVESDQKKAAFLRAAALASDSDAVIHACRVEDLPAGRADVVTARAVAPLERLIPMVAPFMAEGSVAILPKGSSVEGELKAVARHWHLWYSRYTSMTDPRGSILVINRLYHDPRL